MLKLFFCYIAWILLSHPFIIPYFLDIKQVLNEYSGGKQGEAAQNTPNVINLFYSHYEYENEYHIGSKESILYHAIKKLSFPDSYKNAPYGTYPIGGDLAPSFIKRYKLPATFAAIELSDPFIPKLFEYQIIYQYDNAGNPTDAEISIWLFSDKNEGEQLTICIMVRQKPDHILIIGSILGISNINSPLQNYTLIAAVPKAYFPAAAKKGTVQLIEYATRDYTQSSRPPITKKAYVYLPYDYNANDAAVRYDTLFYMHGWTGVAGELFTVGDGFIKICSM